MDLFWWTLFGIIAVTILPTLNYAFTWKHGPSVIQKLGSMFFNGLKRTLALYLLLVSLVYWIAKSYLSGFRLGLGVGITSEVTPVYLLISLGEWMFIIIMYFVIIAGMFRHPFFQWVFPPYSKRIADIWILRAHIWNRSSNTFERFLSSYYMRKNDSMYHFYKTAIEKIADRNDWIGYAAKNVLLKDPQVE